MLKSKLIMSEKSELKLLRNWDENCITNSYLIIAKLKK